jgi:hypothetical protein
MNILSEIRKNFQSGFVPSRPEDYFALRLARGLGDEQAAAHYALLTAEHSFACLLAAYGSAISKTPRETAAARFHQILKVDSHINGNGLSHSRLLAVKIERRAIAAALFSGFHLEGRQVLQLSSVLSRAESSVAGLLRRLLRENDCQSAAVETIAGNGRRSALRAVIIEQCRDSETSVWDISPKLAFSCISLPAPKNRAAMRAQMQRIWPLGTLGPSQLSVLDAAALGLYIQVERLFSSVD